jgi:sterol desaturase/sphingolipid hydroxylase (fatty acid hydroxylase superfamily)
MISELIKRYEFWLLAVSLGCLLAERVNPWRKQKVLRQLFVQDVFWIFFNGYLFARLFHPGYTFLFGRLDSVYASLVGTKPQVIQLLASFPLWLQIPLFLILADFIEWCVHNALHRVGWLWKIHRVHHSIKVMDWIGNFRFHWLESIIYNLVKHLPLALLGARWETILIVAVFATTIGHLNHSNLAISWGPLRYVFNSAKMHIWHHEKELRGKAGVNFGIVLSIWDWLFGTAYMPLDKQPEEIGFSGEENFPDSLLWRLFLPFLNTGRKE